QSVVSKSNMRIRPCARRAVRDVGVSFRLMEKGHLVALAAVLGLLGLASRPAAEASPLTANRKQAPLVAFADAFVRGKTDDQRIASYRRLRAIGVRVVRLDFRWIDLERIGRPLHRYLWAQQDREV